MRRTIRHRVGIDASRTVRQRPNRLNNPLFCGSDRNPREHEFAVQLRAFDASRCGRSLGIAALLAMCSSLIAKSLRGGLVVVGGMNLGGSIDPVHNAVNVAELAISKGASTLLVPVSARKQLNDLPDDLITKVNILYYTDAREALLKAIVE